ncbi:unnamed protein product [Didymodactylos carnosus]|uniref:Craniofacial development protein 2-like n=1 Tax=Didymodactylos carnosus TaxID=1234261 RepID=A0A814WNX2_9BILA|nr:unnamed protein product [Didymodactylos carnosus]CAF1203721.1 unnamed protein product [Didymodactylos carnosus]CAF3570141.1 unnamed protein product [Didymodactylos carnosus]CAF3968096.1 unnamed protein product [Didymodactylos carnosus]
MANGDEKSEFYDALSDCIKSIPKHNVKLVLADMNARIGRDMSSRTIGSSLYHDKTNDNGERLIELCEMCDMREIQSRFRHRQGRLWMWRHTSGQTAQLDHILVTSKWRNSIRNCRAYNTMNVDSDHRVVCCKFKLRLRAIKKCSVTNIRYNYASLKYDMVKERFNMVLANRFEALQNVRANDQPNLDKGEKVRIQNCYDTLIESIDATATEVLGRKKKISKKTWLKERTIMLMKERDNAKLFYERTRTVDNRSKWKELSSKVEQECKKDETEYLKEKISDLNTAIKRHKITDVWKIVNDFKWQERKEGNEGKGQEWKTSYKHRESIE